MVNLAGQFRVGRHLNIFSRHDSKILSCTFMKWLGNRFQMLELELGYLYYMCGNFGINVDIISIATLFLAE